MIGASGVPARAADYRDGAAEVLSRCNALRPVLSALSPSVALNAGVPTTALSGVATKVEGTGGTATPQTLLSVTGGGILHFAALYEHGGGDRVISMKVTVDGHDILDYTGAEISNDRLIVAAGGCAMNGGTIYAVMLQRVPFYSSLSITATGSADTDDLFFFHHYTPCDWE